MRAESLADLADMTAWLPPGCALWRSVGGPLSWSEETHLLNIVDYRLQVLAWQQSKDGSTGKNRPKPPANPKYAREKEAAEGDGQRKAAAYRKRQRSAIAP